MLTFLMVVARVLANPVSNVFQKQLTGRGEDPTGVIAFTHALLALAVLPAVVMPGHLPASPQFWTNMALCAVLAVASNVLLVIALRESDLSVLGPINAYKAVISMILGLFLLGEVPTLFGVIGVALIVSGSCFLADPAPADTRRGRGRGLLGERGVQLRLAALLLSATEAVFLKRAIQFSSPGTTFLWWCLLSLPIALVAMAFLARRRLGEAWPGFRRNRWTYLGLAITTGVMQLATLVAFGQLQVGYSLALFQLSAVVSVFLGHHVFQEPNLRRRLTGSVIMVTGSVLIALLGR